MTPIPQAKAQTKTKNEKKGEKKRENDLKYDESAGEEPYITKGEVGRIRESSHVTDEVIYSDFYL